MQGDPTKQEISSADPVAAWNDASDQDRAGRTHASSETLQRAATYDGSDQSGAGGAPPTLVATLATIPAHVWAPILFAMAALLCVSAGFDVLTILTPGSASNSRWRFSMIGAAVPKLLKVVAAGALLTFGVAYGEKRILSYVFGTLLCLAAVALISVVPLFILDALQVRMVLPAKLTGDVFVANVSFTIALLVFMSLVTLLCGLMLFKVGRWLSLDLNNETSVAVRVWDR